MIHVLILFAHVGMMGQGNSNSLTTAEFNTMYACEVALQSAKNLSSGSTKVITGFCAKK